MKKIGLFYGPKGGNTEKTALKIASAIGNELVDIIAVADIDEKKLEPYQHLIFGIATLGKETWDGNHTKKDWDYFMTRLNHANLKNKKAAIFGLGDHISYASYFVDDIGYLAEKLEKAGATLIGKVSASGYTFEHSKALKNGMFCGLPIDENYEPHLTDQRISDWVKVLKNEFEI